MLLRSLLIATALPLVLAACAGPPAPGPDAASPDPLEAQGAWKLASATTADGAVLLPAGSGYRIQFSDHKVNVLGGCNRMFGGYALSAGTLRIGALASTRMACPEPAMQHDTTIARLLEQPLSMSLMESHPEQLRLKTPAGDTLSFTAIPLE